MSDKMITSWSFEIGLEPNVGPADWQRSRNCKCYVGFGRSRRAAALDAVAQLNLPNDFETHHMIEFAKWAVTDNEKDSDEYEKKHCRIAEYLALLFVSFA